MSIPVRLVTVYGRASVISGLAVAGLCSSEALSPGPRLLWANYDRKWILLLVAYFRIDVAPENDNHFISVKIVDQNGGVAVPGFEPRTHGNWQPGEKFLAPSINSHHPTVVCVPNKIYYNYYRSDLHYVSSKYAADYMIQAAN